MLERSEYMCELHKLHWMKSATFIVLLYTLPFVVSNSPTTPPLVRLHTGGDIMTGTVKASNTAFYQLDLSNCSRSDILNVEAIDLERDKELVGQSVKGKSTVMLMVNTLGQKPKASALRSGLCNLNNGTVADCAGYKLARPYLLLHFNFSAEQHSVPWIVGLLNDNTWANLSIDYSVRAWCTASPSCPKNCWGLGTCSIDGICDCEVGRGGKGCGAIVEALPNGETFNRVLEPGGWDYFTYRMESNQILLVEMLRERGDPILFVKRREEGFVSYGVPNVFDFSQHADTSSFRERSDYHYMFLKAGKDKATVGIFNNDADFSEEAIYNITVRSTQGDGLGLLCPLNCSYPRGHCSSQGNSSVCLCKSGFAGRFCEGTLAVAALSVPVKIRLLPGMWAYVEYVFNERIEDVIIGFEHKGGQTILVALEDNTPTLSHNSYRFTSPPSNETQLGLFSLKSMKQSQGRYVFGIYNMNYNVHSASDISLTFSLAEDDAIFISPLLAVLIAVVGSLVLCLCFGIYRALYLQYRRNLEHGGFEDCPDTGRGIDEEVIAQFPLVSFEKDSSSATNDTRCVVCLADYDAGEVLRKIPKCDHLFHVQCIGTWLRSHSTCPICRLVLRRPRQKKKALTVVIQENSSNHQSSTDPSRINSSSHVSDSLIESQSNDIFCEPLVVEVASLVCESPIVKVQVPLESSDSLSVRCRTFSNATTSQSNQISDLEEAMSQENSSPRVELVRRFQISEPRVSQSLEGEIRQPTSSLPSHSNESLCLQPGREKDRCPHGNGQSVDSAIRGQEEGESSERQIVL